jgi:TonB family protein
LMVGSEAFVEPAYPPNTISGGTVVAKLHSVSGSATHVDIVSGEEPFASSSKAALQNWSLHSEKDALVVVYFRQPNLYYMGDAGQEIRCSGEDATLPCPNYVVGPAYPAHASGQGSVVLRLEIGDDGSVFDVRTLKAMGVFTEISVEAVRKWRFSPAEDARGMKKASRAYAVFVFRFPLIQQKK